jgi:hypothetical protein
MMMMNILDNDAPCTVDEAALHVDILREQDKTADLKLHLRGLSLDTQI